MNPSSNRVASRFLTTPTARNLLRRVAMDFHTQEALDGYLEDHPNADKKNHRVMETDKPSGGEASEAPKPMSSLKQLLEYGTAQQAERDTWSEEAQVAAKDYTGGWFTDVNQLLRSGGKGKGGDNEEKVKEIVGQLDKLFDSPASKLKEAVTVSRGVSGDSHPLIALLKAGQLEPGMEMEDSGYSSTSVKSWDLHSWDTDLKLNIHVPKGAHGLYVGPPPPPPKGGATYSEYPNEFELLLNRGTKMRVTKVDRETMEISMEVVL